MSGDVQLELWLHEYKLNALATVLAEEDTTVGQRMQDALTELYVKLVPPPRFGRKSASASRRSWPRGRRKLRQCRPGRRWRTTAPS